LRRAALKVRAENRKLGLPLILWQDGKVVELPLEPSASSHLSGGRTGSAASVRGSIVFLRRR